MHHGPKLNHLAAAALTTFLLAHPHDAPAADLASTDLTGRSTTTEPAQKVFSTELRAALHQFHEVVGNTRFQRNLSKGNLTEEQYAYHLTQRYFIHKALDQALSSDSAQKDSLIAAVYGKDQKQAFEFLKQDLDSLCVNFNAMSDSSASKATLNAVTHIRALAENDKRALVGYLHSFTCGLPFGGRTIAYELTEDALLQDPPRKYYNEALSVEYYTGAHAPALDRVTDPTDRASIVAAAKLAYQDIIACGNDDFYKPKHVAK